MRINHGAYTAAMTDTALFRVARAVLPEALMLALFARRVPATMSPSRADVRRAVAVRRFRR